MLTRMFSWRHFLPSVCLEFRCYGSITNDTVYRRYNGSSDTSSYSYAWRSASSGYAILYALQIDSYFRHSDGRHRGFAFVTFGTPIDVSFSFPQGTSSGIDSDIITKAQDAIDNMDMNELQGKVLKVSLARPQRAPVQGAGNRASMSIFRILL
jgi:hypothetical protein